MFKEMRSGLSRTMLKSLIIDSSNRKLEGFRKYTDELDSKFEQDKKHLAESYNLFPENDLEDEHIRSAYESLSDDFFEIHNLYISTFRRSTLVAIYSFLERQLHLLCKRLEKSNNFPVSPTDLRGEGVVRSKDYLSKLAGVDFSHSTLNGYWSNISNLNKVRNQIVHAEGYVKRATPPQKPSTIENVIDNTPGLSINSFQQIDIEREYIDNTINSIESFLTALYNQTL